MSTKRGADKKERELILARMAEDKAERLERANQEKAMAAAEAATAAARNNIALAKREVPRAHAPCWSAAAKQTPRFPTHAKCSP